MYLQAAIDADTIEEAELSLINLSRVPEVSVIEIGTPIISHYGVSSVKTFSKYVGTDRLYVDLKSIDFPLVEIRPYREVGVSRFSVMAFMNDEALAELANFAADQKLEVFVSTMGFPIASLRERVAQLIQQGFSRFICHGSGTSTATAFFDMTKRAQLLAEIPEAIRIGAGGINAANAHLLKGLELKGLIIGRGLATAPDASTAAKEILRNVS